MILEGIVTTTNPGGSIHIAAMGPDVDPGISQLTLRPFPDSRTFTNLKERGSGVLHVTDDVEMLVRAALQIWPEEPALEPAQQVVGRRLVDCCRWFEFNVISLDESQSRAEITCEIVQAGEKRPFFGFNRAKHAVLEAAILASRVHLLPLDQITAELDRLEPLVAKTAGDVERRGWSLAITYITHHA